MGYSKNKITSLLDKDYKTIKLEHIISVRKNIDSDKKPTNMPFSLVLLTREREFYLFCENYIERDKWLLAFSHLRRKIDDSPFYGLKISKKILFFIFSRYFFKYL